MLPSGDALWPDGLAASPELTGWITRIFAHLPFTELLSIVPEKVALGELLLRQKIQPCCSRSATDRRLHRGALLGAIDSASGAVCQTVCGPGSIPATIDLRVDWLLPDMPSEEIFLHAKVIFNAERTLCAQIRVYLQSGALLAVAVSNFANQKIEQSGWAEPIDPRKNGVPEFNSFEALMAAQYGEAGLVIPDNNILGGNLHLPAFHGGSIAAALDMQGEKMAAGWAGSVAPRILSTTLQFWRPGVLTEPLLVTGQVERAGRTMAFIATEVRQSSSGSRLLARAQSVFTA